ncbi:MAG: glycosyltransferase [archaeon]|nr:glycosyltransferase [archaeon]
MSSLTDSTGNRTTALRLGRHVGAVALYDCSEQPPEGALEGERLCLVAVHALRSASAVLSPELKPSSSVILVLGGTDVNEFASQPAARQIMDRVVARSRFVVAFSPALASLFVSLWPAAASRLTTIPPAVEVFDPLSSPAMSSRIISSFSSLSSSQPLSLRANFPQLLPTDAVLLLPAGLRPVKDPLLLADAIEAWSGSVPPPPFRLFLLVVGPRLDPSFCEGFFRRVAPSPWLLYHEAVPSGLLHASMGDFAAVINSSHSEGLSNVLLEAMHLRVPVIARSIPGNRAVVSHLHTGLLFDHPQEVPLLVQRLLTESSFRQGLVDRAHAFVTSSYSLDSERLAYRQLVAACFHPDPRPSMPCDAKSENRLLL